MIDAPTAPIATVGILEKVTPHHRIVELSVIVPTFNERENVEELVARLHQCLGGLAWEVIFVDDDSPDDTSGKVRMLAQLDANVRVIQRIGRRGLSSACVEGMLASAAPYLAVIDADMQHDETLLPLMLQTLKREGLDIVVGSRYVDGGGTGEWGDSRVAISKLATRLSRFVVPVELKDPMSGYFMLTRDAFVDSVRNLSSLGFKILVDLFASSSRPLRFKELPYVFRNRVAGESKLDGQAAWDYCMLLLDKMAGHILPVRFVPFAVIGGMGVLVHMAMLGIAFKGMDWNFRGSQLGAAIVAMVFNFSLNNAITYRDRRLRGVSWIRGLVSFMLACSVGTLANVGIASYLFDRDGGWFIAAFAGIVVGAVWNYAMTSVYTWGGKTNHGRGQ